MNKRFTLAKILLGSLALSILAPACDKDKDTLLDKGKEKIEQPQESKEDDKASKDKKAKDKSNDKATEKDNPKGDEKAKDESEGGEQKPPKNDKPEPPKNDKPLPPIAPEPPKGNDPTESYEVAGNRNLVILDFTGQRCGYCSTNTARHKYQMNEYGKEKYIPVALHSSYHYSPNLYVTSARDYDRHLGIRGFPTNKYSNKKTESRPVSQMLQDKDIYKTEAKLTVKGREIELEVLPRVYHSEKSQHKEALNVLVWIIENEVKAFQNMGRHYEDKYVHDFVYREYIGSLWGKPIELGKPLQMKHTLSNKVLNPENCELVVMLLGRDSKLILDATRLSMKK